MNVSFRLTLLLTVAATALTGQTDDPLQGAYSALREREYDTAIKLFRQAAARQPNRSSIRKDLAYTYLKTGETEAARDQFAEAMRLDPADTQAALEYAFLCHETGKAAEARRVFDRIRKTGDPDSRKTAETAFSNIDGPLAEGIARWSEALRRAPGNFSAHHELARLAEQRGELALAAEHYEKAWRLRPVLRPLLVSLGRVYKAAGDNERAMAALLAASRGAEPRAAEEARSLLPSRYPYVYEFRQALELDAENTELRRELAYLFVAMGRKDDAEKEFALLAAKAQNDAAGPPAEPVLGSFEQVLALAERSYQAGYLKDALKYFTKAHEADPLNFPVMLNLGWTHNMLGQDDRAVRWFEMARRSPDPKIAAEAARAYRNLQPPFLRFRTSVWLFPIYSSRWRDVFAYGQVKSEVKLGNLPLRAYATTRFVGDIRGSTREVQPQYLSERAVIVGAGVATDYWRGLLLWAEAGRAIPYARNGTEAARSRPDYRGGVSFSRGFGRLLGGESGGTFFETNEDGVFLSRFGNDVLFYSQNRFGYTLPVLESLGGFQIQFYWNGNAGADAKRQYWANTVEGGPGVRFRWKAMPRPWIFSINLLRGAHTRNEGNPRGPHYWDVRAGIWFSGMR